LLGIKSKVISGKLTHLGVLFAARQCRLTITKNEDLE